MLIFDGTNWVEQAPGTLHTKEGGTDKGLAKEEYDFDLEEFLRDQYQRCSGDFPKALGVLAGTTDR